MSENEKYFTVLKELGGLLQEKNDRIALLEWQLDKLKSNISSVEKQKGNHNEINTRRQKESESLLQNNEAV